MAPIWQYEWGMKIITTSKHILFLSLFLLLYVLGLKKLSATITPSPLSDFATTSAPTQEQQTGEGDEFSDPYEIEIIYRFNPDAWGVYNATEAKISQLNLQGPRQSQDKHQKILQLQESLVLNDDSLSIISQKGDAQAGGKVKIGVFDFDVTKIQNGNKEHITPAQENDLSSLREYAKSLISRLKISHKESEFKEINCLRERHYHRPITCTIALDLVSTRH